MQLIPLNFLPGTQRDGTMLDADRAIDSLWCRWRLGRPRKIGGFFETYNQLRAISRRIHMYYSGDRAYVHIGTGKSLQQVVLDLNGNFISAADRTPQPFTSGPNCNWTIDSLFDTVSSAVQIIAHAAPNINVVAQTLTSVPVTGMITGTDRLVPLTNSVGPIGGQYDTPAIAGGIVCVQPYLFDFNVDGFIGWSAPNSVNSLGISGGTTGAGKARVSAQKIVAGMAQRGGGVNSPAALFWSLSEVITAQFIGSPAFFAFNTVSPSSSILSPNTVIEYDGLYMWAGIDRFLMYNGTVVEIPNLQNQDWFFDNMNWEYAGKAYAFKVPKFGEIWFCAPLFGNTECSHAAIFNIRENTWYDTELPNGGRGAGYFAQGFRYPVMGGTRANQNGQYSLWVHERGKDQTSPNAEPVPVRSYFDTPYIGSVKSQQPDDHSTSFEQIEADIIQSGDMSVYVRGGFNARSGAASGKTSILTAVPPKPGDQLIGIKSEFRLGSIHFESNTLGGSYVTGKSILHSQQGGARMLGGPGVPLTQPVWLTTDDQEGLLDNAGDQITEG